MKISDLITEKILDMLEQTGGMAEIQRNELASMIGCVPSQINYVITSRFTPEQGYIIESRRGGGGYIKIKRIQTDRNQLLMHIVNSVGTEIDSVTSRVIIENLQYQNVLSEQAAKFILAAVSDKGLRALKPPVRDYVRAEIFKQMLLTAI